MGDTIVNGIKSIFVPEEDFITNKVQEVRNNFVFVDSVINTFEYIKERLTSHINAGSGSAPKLKMTVDIKGESKEVTMIDLSWYRQFKPYGDLILSAIMYVFFAWRVFRNLPNTINGVGSDVDTISKL